MCGIVGTLVFDKSDFIIKNDYINAMRDAMTHRGPDGAGTWISGDRKIGFGHRRLSIIDLSENAAQPMLNQEESVVLTFNGEIYNYAEIRSELEKTGKYQWKTDHSDTEVLLHAYEEWDTECLKKFRGMFAFAIWDTKKEELWVVRDRLGIKPLYYTIHDDRFVFASEIKALLQDPQQKREVDEKALYDYLSFLVSPAPRTLFKGIYKLPCATWLKIGKNGILTEEKYWDMFENKLHLESCSEDKIAQVILKKFNKAVNLRKVSDVPVGVFLSGGVDSSANAMLFSKRGKMPVKTFTIGYNAGFRTYGNENENAKKLAKQINAEFYEKKLTVEDIASAIPEVIRLQDEPLADPVCIPQYYVSKIAKEEGVTVCQIGEGADELFSGYATWNSERDAHTIGQLPMPDFFKEYALKAYGRYNQYTNESRTKEKIRRVKKKQPVFWGSNDIFTDEEKREILSKKVNQKIGDYTSWESIEPVYKRFQKNAKKNNTPLNWMTYVDLTVRLPELLLTKVDKMGMGVSLEARVPFLDHKFVEFVMNIPTKVKIKGRAQKYIFKKAVRGLIPDEIIDRKKVGFGLPVNELILKEFGKSMKNDILYFCSNTEYFDEKAISKLLRQNDAGKIWPLYNLAMWWKEYIQKEVPDEN